MNTTNSPIRIATVNGLPLFLEEGKGENISVLTYGDKSAAVGHADWALGEAVADAYREWYDTNRSDWWKAPDEGEESHTPSVWEAIAKAAEAAGDHRRAEYARLAGEAEERNMGAA